MVLLLQILVIYSEVIAVATVREGNKASLLVVDVQVGVMSESWDALRIIKNVSRGSRPEAKGSSSLYDCLRQGVC